MQHEFRRFIALALLFMTITGLVVSFGESVTCAGERPGAHETVGMSSTHDTGQTHDNTGPNDPSSSPSTYDHICVDNCGCPCNAPMPATVISATYSQSFTYLLPAETTRHLPEVYFSLLVPPDSALL